MNMRGDQDSAGKLALPSPFILCANEPLWLRTAGRQVWARMVCRTRRMLRSIEQQDHRLMDRVHAWSAPGWLRCWMMVATRAGDGGLWGLLGVLVLCFGGPGGDFAVAAAASSSLAGIILFMSVKRIVRRRRPCATRQHCWARLSSPDPYSFPSGHTLTAFAVTVPLLLYSPLLGLALLFCSCSVAASRIVLGMHFLSDVLTGLLFGCGLGYASFLLVMK